MCVKEEGETEREKEEDDEDDLRRERAGDAAESDVRDGRSAREWDKTSERNSPD